MHIILPLDGSQGAFAAVDMVANLPWPEKPDVTVVSALVEAPYDFSPSHTGTWLYEAELEAATKQLDAAKARLADGCNVVDHVIQRNHPRRLILETAKEHNADLIAMGARGHSAAYRIVLGSTADYVANHAKCSVLIARPGEQEAAADSPFRVLLAFDGSDESAQAYQQMSEFRWPEESTEIHMAMMLEKPKLIPEDIDYDPELVAESKNQLAQLKRPEEIADHVRHSVHETYHVGNSLTSLAATDNTDLLFIGGTGKSSVVRFFLGSTSRYVLHHAPCSLWVARNRQWD